MSYKIVRNDISKMQCEAIVNTANENVAVGPGCDNRIYRAAGYDKLLNYRKENIGFVNEGEAFLTPGFELYAKYIVHVVSPKYIDGNSGEEERLRNCYRNALRIALENEIKSIAFPLISTGSYRYPKEEGLRIALDEIKTFLDSHEMEITIVVYGNTSVRSCEKLGEYVSDYFQRDFELEEVVESDFSRMDCQAAAPKRKANRLSSAKDLLGGRKSQTVQCVAVFYEEHETELNERMKHLSDSFSEYLLYLIESKGMTNAEVYKRAIVDKKVFSKIKNNPEYHPQKMTAMCLCVGARLNLDETKDLLARAGYALSPCDKTDIIFSYFIENKIYDMIELDIQLEEYGQKCLIS